MSWINKTKSKASQLITRGLDRHVTIAVTGLSGSGKSAFITSFINQLLFAPSYKQLPFFEASAEDRLKASKLASHDDMHIPSFPYQTSMSSLSEENPRWPASTVSISKAQLKCRFNIKHNWYNKLRETASLTIDLVDYPGEWLLDLPLLDMTYKSWCKLCLRYLKSERRQQFTKDVYKEINGLNYEYLYEELSDKEILARVHKHYSGSLKDYRDTHTDFSLALPGRFILPGEYEGTAALEFFPVLNPDIINMDWKPFKDNSILKTLEKRFEYYKSKVIKPFFDEYFSKVDRQIVLIDTTNLLESDYESYQDLQYTLQSLLSGFSYGRANWLKRLFSPSIDRLMLATTKIDLVPPDQHSSLEAFMSKMLAQAKNDVSFEGVDVETMAISALSTSEPVSTQHQGKTLVCVQGKDQTSGEPVIHYPGKVPSSVLSREQWRELNIDFTPFGLPALSKDEPLPHIRMDKVIEYLVGDKFI